MANEEKKQIGKILVQRKLVSLQELETALRVQKRSLDKKPLASHFADTGRIPEIEALRALSEQYGVPGIDLSQVAILLEHLDVVPREVAEAHRILPVLMRGDRIFLAMADPTEKRVIDELEFVTGKKVYPYIALSSTLERAIAASYENKARGEVYYFGPSVPEETLRQLGVSVPVERTAKTERAIPVARPPSIPPDPRAILDPAMERASDDWEVSTAEFGQIEEASSVGYAPVLPGSSRTGKRILVVDDEPDIRNLLARLLRDKGHQVFEADRGLLALRLVKEHLPDLIVLDAMLPELHGFDIARRIKGSAKYGKIPIIMISAIYRGWSIAQDLKQNYGIEEYLEKPFRIADVLAAVGRVFSQEQSRVAVAPPRDPEAMDAEAEQALNAGIAAYRGGQVDVAIEHLKRGVGIDPLSYRLHFHLALLLGKQGLVYEAIQALERAVDLHPKNFSALKNLAVLYEKAGFKHKATEMWQRSLRVAPDEPTRTSIKEHLLKLL
ncbi:MAG: response regulator [Myxococcales bacterium]